MCIMFLDCVSSILSSPSSACFSLHPNFWWFSAFLASVLDSRCLWRLCRPPSTTPAAATARNFLATRCLLSVFEWWLLALGLYSTSDPVRGKGSDSGGSGRGIVIDMGGSGRGIPTDIGDSCKCKGLVSGDMQLCWWWSLTGVSNWSSVGLPNSTSRLAICRRFRSWLARCSQTDTFIFLRLSRRPAKALTGCSSACIPAASSSASAGVGRPRWMARFLYKYGLRLLLHGCEASQSQEGYSLQHANFTIHKGVW